jgi:hypothetical protein
VQSNSTHTHARTHTHMYACHWWQQQLSRFWSLLLAALVLSTNHPLVLNDLLSTAAGGAADGGASKQPDSLLFWRKAIICQDRLGTDTRKAEPKRRLSVAAGFIAPAQREAVEVVCEEAAAAARAGGVGAMSGGEAPEPTGVFTGKETCFWRHLY